MPRAEEAIHNAARIGKERAGNDTYMPPLPSKALAIILLFCRIMKSGSMVILPPTVHAPPATLVLIVLSLNGSF